MRILFLSNWFPYPQNNGSKIRIFNLLRGLSVEHEITLLSFSDQPVNESNFPELDSICNSVKIIPLKPYQPSRYHAPKAFLSSIPRSIRYTFSMEMAHCISETLSRRTYDLAIASQIGTAAYSNYLRGLPSIFEEVEAGVFYDRFIRAGSLQERIRSGLTWAKYHRYLASLLSGYTACTVASEKEKWLVNRLAPDYKNVEVIPNCIHLADYLDVTSKSVFSRPNTLIFTGSFRYLANHEAMVWFIRDVFPRILAQVPDVQLVITGDHAGLSLPSTQNVTLTGMVEDIKPLVASATVSLAPLRTGGGTRLKILEAMALGTPVVATSKGAEGLSVQPGQHLLVADTPIEFAENVVRLLKDAELRENIGQAAKSIVREKYDWGVVMPHFMSLVDMACQAKKRF